MLTLQTRHVERAPDALGSSDVVHHGRISAAGVLIAACVALGLLLAVTLQPASAGRTSRPAPPQPAVQRLMATEMWAGVHDARSGYLPTRMSRVHR